MSNMEIGFIGMGLMLVLFATGMPVTYVMTLVGMVGFSVVVSPAAGLNLLAREMYDSFTGYGLIVIPLFTLMGQLALNAGISRRVYDMSYKLAGGTKGGLAMSTVIACTAFGAVCGSSSATAATMATVGMPEMRRYGYNAAFAAGTVAAGGSMGMLMPPSLVLIVYGVITQQSIGSLFVAGVIPAFLVMGLFMGAVALVCWRWPSLGPAGEKSSFLSKILALKEMGEVLAVFLLVMSGLILGWFTPTEAGAVGAAGTLAVGLIRRQLTWKGFCQAITDTLWTSCMTLMLVAGAGVLGKFLAVTRIPFAVANMVAGLGWPAWATMGLIVFIYLVGGCFIDALALVMLTIPIFYPIVEQLGFDPIWFGVMIVLVTQMGVITPPVGLNVYVVSGMTDEVSLEAIFKGALPYLAALIVGAGLMVAFPALVTWLPGVITVY